uniref:(northern house mosquito) hypothetical protein n=1 Tax=Culex pipiens TaxID=7175 RepID=A0A8D8B8P0_CULPI
MLKDLIESLLLAEHVVGNLLILQLERDFDLVVAKHLSDDRIKPVDLVLSDELSFRCGSLLLWRHIVVDILVVMFFLLARSLRRRLSLYFWFFGWLYDLVSFFLDLYFIHLWGFFRELHYLLSGFNFDLHFFHRWGFFRKLLDLLSGFNYLCSIFQNLLNGFFNNLCSFFRCFLQGFFNHFLCFFPNHLFFSRFNRWLWRYLYDLIRDHRGSFHRWFFREGQLFFGVRNVHGIVTWLPHHVGGDVATSAKFG